ncbi:MAG: hypothetical protein EXR27_19740 [Betaproteobacteria bacterium]|nr:hypothetical protein [Betaproteobacteria bacterium]
MSVKSRRIASNLRKVDSHVIAADEYEELPEVSVAMLARAEYRVGDTIEPRPRRRGPQRVPTKVPLSLRLSPEVVEHYKAGGAGWQTRIDEALKKLIAAGRRTSSKA